MDHTRHSALFDVSKLHVTLIGAGGIGAMTAMVLAKMGIGGICIIDDDIVNDVNLATQFHRLADIGRPKSFALFEALAEYSDELQSSSAIQARVDNTNERLKDNIIISAVDSITSRQAIYKAIDKCVWYLDARMAAEEFQLYSVRWAQKSWYEKIILGESDDDIPDDPCTSKATIYTAAIAAGHIGSVVKNIATGEQTPCKLVHNIRTTWLEIL